MVDPGIPDEVKVQEVLQIETRGLAALPEFDTETIQLTEDGTLAPTLAEIARYQVTCPF